MRVREVREYLDRHRVRYISIRHSPAYTPQEIASALRLPGNSLAKTVLLKRDGKMIMAVLPASHQVNYYLFRKVCAAKELEPVSEAECKAFFPECEVGALPPFGNLYGMSVFVAQTLAEDREIAFYAGSHSELIRLLYRDYERLVHPKVSNFSVKIRS